MNLSNLMTRKPLVATVGVLVLGAGLTAVAMRFGRGSGPAEGGHGGSAPEPEKGPHGGRLLEDGTLAVEVTIYERGIPPEFRVFLYEDGKPLDPAAVRLTIELHRFGGKVDTIGFTKREDYLLGDREIIEPHSFDVKVTADRKGRASRWEYPSYEGRTSMTAEAVQSSGITLETAGAAKVSTVIRVNGRVEPNVDHLGHVIPR